MALAAMTAIKGVRIPAQERPHRPGEGPLSGADEEMEMVRQERPGIDVPGLSGRPSGYALEPVLAILRVVKDPLAVHSPGHDMVQNPGRIETGASWHASFLA